MGGGAVKYIHPRGGRCGEMGAGGKYGYHLGKEQDKVKVHNTTPSHLVSVRHGKIFTQK